MKKCNSAGKPVITATHMLDSMERNPRPTRAESSDVANAIFDGSDAVMLSGETAIGKYPVETIKTMAKLATITEEALEYEKIGAGNQEISHQSITDAISYATYTIAANLNASAILTPTASGSTARMVSKYRPKGPIIAVSANEDTLNYLCLVWGVFPIKVPWLENTDEVFDAGIAAALDKRFIEHGDLVVVTAGIPIGVPGTTNLLKVHVVGEILGKGTALGKQIVKGCAKVAATHEEACENIEEGDILVTAETDKNYIPALKKAAAVVTEKGGLSSHAVISALNFKIPAIIGAEGVCKNIKNGEMITIDGLRGIIYRGAAKVTS